MFDNGSPYINIVTQIINFFFKQLNVNLFFTTHLNNNLFTANFNLYKQTFFHRLQRSASFNWARNARNAYPTSHYTIYSLWNRVFGTSRIFSMSVLNFCFNSSTVYLSCSIKYIFISFWVIRPQHGANLYALMYDVYILNVISNRSKHDHVSVRW